MYTPFLVAKVQIIYPGYTYQLKRLQAHA